MVCHEINSSWIATEGMEIKNIKKDAIRENAEIISYKICSQLAGKLNVQDAISVCQQNTEEQVSMETEIHVI
jgi:hypothetical protein